jgi:hypothetical protein
MNDKPAALPHFSAFRAGWQNDLALSSLNHAKKLTNAAVLAGIFSVGILIAAAFSTGTLAFVLLATGSLATGYGLFTASKAVQAYSTHSELCRRAQSEQAESLRLIDQLSSNSARIARRDGKSWAEAIHATSDEVAPRR